MRNQDRESRKLGAAAVAAFAGIVLATFSVVATQPRKESVRAAVALAAVPTAAVQESPAFVMPGGVAAQADAETFEYY